MYPLSIEETAPGSLTGGFAPESGGRGGKFPSREGCPRQRAGCVTNRIVEKFIRRSHFLAPLLPFT